MSTSRNGLPDVDGIALAREVAQRAYSPYSRVQVGAVLRGVSGRAWTGCNVENASFGLTLCAERTALVKAVSEGERAFESLVLWSNRAPGLAPCGACRQVLAEFAPRLRLWISGSDGVVREASLELLLPDPVCTAQVLETT